MKIKLLLLLGSIGISLLGQSQLNRLVNISSASNNYKRNTVLTERNGELLIGTIKDGINQLELTTFTMDASGETDNYFSHDLSALTSTRFALSGCGTMANGEYQFVLLEGVGTLTQAINYIHIDPVTNSSNIYTLPITFKEGLTKTVQKGDSLVTYVVDPIDGIKRISALINDPSIYTLNVIDPAEFPGTSLTNSRKVIDFVVDPTDGSEFISINTRVYKRTNSGVVTSIPVTNFSANSVEIGINSSGQLLQISQLNYMTFDNNLSNVNSGTLSYSISGLTTFLDVAPYNGKWLIYYSKTQGNFDRVVFNPTTAQVENVSTYGRGTILNVLDIVETSFGQTSVFHTGVNANAIMTDNNSILEAPFNELGTEVDHYGINYNTAIKNQFFTNQNGTNGFGYTSSNIRKSLIYAGSNTLVGLNGTDLVGSYSNSFQINPNIKFGPYTDPALLTQSIEDSYNYAFHITRGMIDDHITNIGNSSYTIPRSILKWPGNGVTSLGQNQQVAPFFDQNNNGVYEPSAGDYPLIYGDYCDVKFFHQQPDGGAAAALEMIQYIYGFECDTNEALRNTVFVTESFKLIDGSATDSYLLTFTDGDVGNSSDDYVGTHMAGMMYFHNGDLYDEDSGGGPGFHDTLAAVGIATYLGAKLADDQIDNQTGILPYNTLNGFGFNDGTIDNEHYGIQASVVVSNGSFFPNTDPQNIAQMYNTALGLKADGSAYQYNGVDVKYGYFGITDPNYAASYGIPHGNDFSEGNSMNPPGDRRAYQSTGPMDINSLDPNTNSISVTNAYIVSYDSTNTIQDPVKRLTELFTSIKNQYLINNAGCNATFSPYTSPIGVGLEEKTLNGVVYPNPAQNEFTIELSSNTTFDVVIYDALGNKIVERANQSNQCKINSASMSQGLYLIQIISSEGTITKKLLKQ